MVKNGFRFYSFSIKTGQLAKNSYLKLKDGDRTLALPVRKDHTEHLYSNLVVRDRPTLYLEDEFSLREHSLGSDFFVHPEQEKLNKGLKCEKGVTYSIKSLGTPTRAIITFPQHRGFGGWLAPYSIFYGEKLAIDDCLYISFQEPYLTSGSYFLIDNCGEDPVPKAVDIIWRELEKHGLEDGDVTLIGSSKGANIAALVSQYLTGNQLILCNYSTELDYRLRHNFLSYLADTLDLLDITIPDTLEVLATESENKETHWFYTIGDDLANRGHESFEARRLTTYACREPHGEVLRGQWDLIKSLIYDFHTVEV